MIVFDDGSLSTIGLQLRKLLCLTRLRLNMSLRVVMGSCCQAFSRNWSRSHGPKSAMDLKKSSRVGVKVGKRVGVERCCVDFCGGFRLDAAAEGWWT